MFHNIDRPAVVFAGIALGLFVLLMIVKESVRNDLADRRIMREMDKHVDDPNNIEALARSIGALKNPDNR